jgi:4-hydroxythreonine-4-phosphate dehydrogenase
MTGANPRLAVTMGDPAGIGPEITLRALADPAVRGASAPVVLGDYEFLQAERERFGIDVELQRVDSAADAPALGGDTDAGAVGVIDFDNVASPVTRGEVQSEYGRASLAYVERSIDLAVEGTVDGICNAPIHKEAISRAGSEFAGHTDMMAARTGVEEYTPLLTDDELYVTHCSLHVPLATAVEHVSTETVLETIRVTHDHLPEVGIDDPSLGVLGVDPHAGDSGVIGEFDDRTVRPAVERARERGIDARGPLPPDSAFNRALAGEFDCMIAMYHDQGHIPLFVNSYVDGGGVAATVIVLGFPFVRTTTLHGTAYDIAGDGVAAPDSMLGSVQLAAEAVRHRS